MLNAANVPDDVWLAIASHLRANDIQQLSNALHLFNRASPCLVSRLEWLQERAAGLFRYGCRFAVILLRRQRPLTQTSSILRLFSPTHHRHLVRSLALHYDLGGYPYLSEKDRISVLKTLIQECDLPADYLIRSIRTRTIYKRPVDDLLELVQGRIDDALISEALTVSRDRCYQAILEHLMQSEGRNADRIMKRIDSCRSLPFLIQPDWRVWAENTPRRNPLIYLDELLHCASKMSDFRIIEIILDHGLLPNTVNFIFRDIDQKVRYMFLDTGMKMEFSRANGLTYEMLAQFADYGAMDFLFIAGILCSAFDLNGLRHFDANGGLEAVDIGNLCEFVEQIDLSVKRMGGQRMKRRGEDMKEIIMRHLSTRKHG